MPGFFICGDRWPASDTHHKPSQMRLARAGKLLAKRQIRKLQRAMSLTFTLHPRGDDKDSFSAFVLSPVWLNQPNLIPWRSSNSRPWSFETHPLSAGF